MVHFLMTVDRNFFKLIVKPPLLLSKRNPPHRKRVSFNLIVWANLSAVALAKVDADVTVIVISSLAPFYALLPAMPVT